MIYAVYDIHPHRNNGKIIDRFVADNTAFQCHWRHIRNQLMRWYDSLIGRMGRCFMKLLMEDFKEVRTRYWNFEPPLVFVNIILPARDNDQYSKNIHSNIE